MDRANRDISLLTGGPFHAALVRARLMDADFQPPQRRLIAFALVTWLPLLVLSIIDGTAFGAFGPGPFLWDLSAHARFLLAGPLLLLAERGTERVAVYAMAGFFPSGIIRKVDYPVFMGILRHITALRRSYIPEAVIVGVLIAFSAQVDIEAGSPTGSWRFADGGAEMGRSLTGWWMTLVSLPLLQFLILRWLWRYMIWIWFLYRVSRMDLRLFPTHPDHAGGLGFLGIVHQSFAQVVFAFSVILSGVAGQEVFYGLAAPEDYRYALLAYAVLVMLLFIGPLFLFSGVLIELRRRGMSDYGRLAQELVWLFHRKWIKRELPREETLVGSPDVSSLADLNGSFEVIRTMQIVPADLANNALPLAMAIVVPFLPWALLLIPFSDLMGFLLGMA